MSRPCIARAAAPFRSLRVDDYINISNGNLIQEVIRANQTGRLDSAVVLSSLYPALTVLLAWFFLKEKFTPWKTAGIVAAVLAVPMIALQ